MRVDDAAFKAPVYLPPDSSVVRNISPCSEGLCLLALLGAMVPKALGDNAEIRSPSQKSSHKSST